MKLKSLILIAGVLLSLLLAPVSWAEEDEYPDVLLQDGWFGVAFLGVTYNEDGTSTWSYRVEELKSGKGFKDLSNWALGLDECVVVLNAEPASYDVGRNPHTGLYSIKWDVGNGLKSGRFSFTVEGVPFEAEVEVATKAGPHVDSGWIAGPSCDGEVYE